MKNLGSQMNILIITLSLNIVVITESKKEKINSYIPKLSTHIPRKGRIMYFVSTEKLYCKKI